MSEVTIYECDICGHTGREFVGFNAVTFGFTDEDIDHICHGCSEKINDLISKIRKGAKTEVKTAFEVYREMELKIEAAHRMLNRKQKTIAEQIDDLPNWDAIGVIYKFFRFQPCGGICYSAIRPVLETNGRWTFGSIFVEAGLAPEHLRKHYKESLRERPAKEETKTLKIKGDK